MYWMVCGIRFFLWFLLLMSTSSFCSGSELDVRCLKSLQRSVIDSRGVLESSWNFSSFICFFTGVECWNESGEEVRVLSLRLSNMGLEGQFPQGLFFPKDPEPYGSVFNNKKKRIDPVYR